MGALLGFGMFYFCPGDMGADEKENFVNDFCSKGLSTKFTDVDTENKTAYFFDTNREPNLVKKDLDETDPLLAISGHCIPIDFDDWAIIFEVEIFLPNYTLEDALGSFTIGDTIDKRISSLEYAIERIEAQKNAYMEDEETMPEEELKELIGQMDEYMDIFITAQKNNLVVSISY